jgi:cytochrome c-type biogenesis protein
VTAMAAALLRASVVARLRRLGPLVPRLGGVVLLLAGGYVAYYGWYEYRLSVDARNALGDPIVEFVADGQRQVSGVLHHVGASGVVVVFAALLLVGWAAGRAGRRTRPRPPRRPDRTEVPSR